MLPVVLIVCEGTKTEPNYLNDLKRDLNLTTVDVIVHGKGADPLSLAQFAKDEYLRLKREKRDIKNENVWVVFDMDEHPGEKRTQAFDMIKGNKFNLAFSNPSFELWYLLHFQEQNSHIHRDKVVELLKNDWISGYGKGSEGIYDKIKKDLDAAAILSKNLRDKHAKDGNVDTENPSTGVDLLVKFLKRLVGK